MSVTTALARGWDYLGLAPEGKYEVVAICTGNRARHQLSTLGIRVGANIRIISKGGYWSPVRVKVLGAEYVIGIQRAMNIMVKRLKDV